MSNQLQMPHEEDDSDFWPRGFPRGPSNDFDDSKRASIFWTLEIASKPLGKIYGQLIDNL